MLNGEEMGQTGWWESVTELAWVTILATPPARTSNMAHGLRLSHSHWGISEETGKCHLPVEDRKDLSFDAQSCNTFSHIITALKDLRCKNSRETFLIIFTGKCEFINTIFQRNVSIWIILISNGFSCTKWKYDSMTAKVSVPALLGREELTCNVAYLWRIYLFSPWNGSVLTTIKREKQKNPWSLIPQWKESDVALNFCCLKIQMAFWAKRNSGILLDVILKFGLFVVKKSMLHSCVNKNICHSTSYHYASHKHYSL